MRLSFLILFLSTSTAINSQIPDYFGNDPEWLIHGNASGGVPCDIDIYEIGYYVNGDTTINGVIYKRIGRHGKHVFKYLNLSSCAPDYYFNLPFYLAMRQDGRKVYWVNEFGNDELFIRYDLNVGDTLPTCFANSHQLNDFIVEKVDSIMIGAVYHRVLYFDTADVNNGLKLIEGIGHFYQGFDHFFRAIYEPFEDVTNIVCYSQFANTLWPDSTATDCNNLFDLGVTNSAFQSIDLYPNPAFDIIYLESTRQITQIMIYNRQGQLVIREQTKNISSVNINTLTPGLYFIEVIDTDGVRNHIKFIKD